MEGTVSRGHADLLRVVCISGITFFHMSFRLQDAWPGAPASIERLLAGLGDLSAPVLGFMSGLLLALSLSRRGASWGLLRRRCVTLLRPFAVWNGVAVGLAVVGMALFGGTPMMDPLSTNGLFGLTAWPFNFPLHYLLDITKAAVAFIGLHALFGRRFEALALAALALLAALWAASPNLTNAGTPLPRVDSTVFFVLGALFGCNAQRSRRVLSALQRRCVPILLLGGPAYVVLALIDPQAVLPFLLKGTLGGVVLVLLVQRLPEPPTWVNGLLALRLLCSHVVVFMVLNVWFSIEASPNLFWYVAQPIAAFAFAAASLEAERRFGPVRARFRRPRGPDRPFGALTDRPAGQPVS